MTTICKLVVIDLSQFFRKGLHIETEGYAIPIVHRMLWILAHSPTPYRKHPTCICLLLMYTRRVHLYQQHINSKLYAVSHIYLVT